MPVNLQVLLNTSSPPEGRLRQKVTCRSAVHLRLRDGACGSGRATSLYPLSLHGTNSLNIEILTSYGTLGDPGSVDSEVTSFSPKWSKHKSRFSIQLPYFSTSTEQQIIPMYS